MYLRGTSGGDWYNWYKKLMKKYSSVDDCFVAEMDETMVK